MKFQWITTTECTMVCFDVSNQKTNMIQQKNRKWIFPENTVQFQKVVSRSLATHNDMTERDIEELMKNIINARGRERMLYCG